MNFDLDHSRELLSRTPAVLRSLLSGLPQVWTSATEGPDTWSAFDVVGHLIHGEKTDWMGRARHILEGKSEPFTPFDREAMFEASRGRSLEDLLDEFEKRRRENLEALDGLNITPADLDRKGTHPALGPVTLRQLLSTWTAHDLGHITQVVRVMAKRYSEDVGPWIEYLSIMRR